MCGGCYGHADTLPLLVAGTSGTIKDWQQQVSHSSAKRIEGRRRRTRILVFTQQQQAERDAFLVLRCGHAATRTKSFHNPHGRRMVDRCTCDDDDDHGTATRDGASPRCIPWYFELSEVTFGVELQVAPGSLPARGGWVASTTPVTITDDAPLLRRGGGLRPFR